MLGEYSKTVADDKMILINQAVAQAQSHEIEVLEMLGSIREIGLAVATKIWTVCYPDNFTIIDTRMLEMLNLFPSALATSKRNKIK